MHATGDKVVLALWRNGAPGEVQLALGNAGKRTAARLAGVGKGKSDRVAYARPGWRTGSVTRNVVPRPGSLVTSMRPLCLCTMP